MKCPHCGYWNKASFPRCFSCGEPLEQTPEAPKTPSWTRELKDQELENKYLRYDETLPDHVPQPELDPAAQNTQTELADSLDELNARRRRGAQYLAAMRERAKEAQEVISSAPVIRPLPEQEEAPDAQGEPQAPVTEPVARRQRRRVAQYMRAVKPDAAQEDFSDDSNDSARVTPVVSDPYSDPKLQPQYVFDDADPNAPVLYDGYEQPTSEKDVGAYTDYIFPRVDESTASASRTSIPGGGARNYVPRRKRRVWPRAVGLTLLVFTVLVGGYFGINYFVEQLSTGFISQESQSAQTTIEEKEVGGLPGHVITISGKEGAQIYIRELQTSYIVTGGVATIELADYTFYESLENVTDSSMDVTLTPFLRASEGDQVALPPINYTIDIPLSPVTLVSPESVYANVSTSIYEIKLNVQRGSRVIIDGENVSGMITTNGNVSKNVQVLPTGDNIFQISVRSQYCRENNMEVTLNRPQQEIPLELDGDSESSSTAKTQSMLLYGTTLPGATVTIESAHTQLAAITATPTATPFVEGAVQVTATPEPTGKPEEDGVLSVVTGETGKFSFRAIFNTIGDNVVTIRSSYPGMEDSVITHTVYWMPDVDIYSRRAWPLSESDYTDLVNNIARRKGQVYVCNGTITRIISDSPQLAIMNTSQTPEGEQPVMLENSTRTIWEIGKTYRIYADAFGLYDTMPRLTARYTYTVDTSTPTPAPDATPEAAK